MLLSFNNTTYEIGARPIIKETSWSIYAKERIGLIGANGVGKSTVLKLMIGEISATGGSISRAKEATIGYFHQDLQSLESNESILQVAAHAFDKAKEIEAKLNDVQQQLETDPNNAKLLDDYSHLLHDFEVAGGYEMEHRSAQVLEGLGFTTTDLQRPFTEFSGGWRMRVILAKMILQQPDLLLLDEPTNHLDLPSIQWLEGFLQGYQGTVLIVSHDRYFLDKMVSKIVEINQQQFQQYTGNYSFFEQEKKLRQEIQQQAYENQQDFIRQQERFIERFKAKASKAAQAQSVVKRLDKLDVIEAPSNSVAQVKINFNTQQQPGKVICTLADITKNFGNISVLKQASAEIMRGDKIGLIGANGKGKSTLLRIIANTEKFEGSATTGHNVNTSFYAQHQLEALNIQHEILEEVKQGVSNYTEPELRSLCGSFLFAGDDVFKKIKVLSGGEKARVALIKTILAKSNFMMLDEPTNHLDLNSVMALAQALNQYSGSYIIVSHDRYFIEQTANKIWEIVDGKIIEYPGPYHEWQEWKDKKRQAQQATEVKPTPVVEVKVVDEPKGNTDKNTSAYKEQQKKLKQVQHQFKKVEDSLAEANSQKQGIELALADPSNYADKSKFVSLEAKYAAISDTVANLQQQYEQLFEELLQLEQQ
jgi:ATP-binding cassette, subfamily F, member 3